MEMTFVQKPSEIVYTLNFYSLQLSSLACLTPNRASYVSRKMPCVSHKRPCTPLHQLLDVVFFRCLGGRKWNHTTFLSGNGCQDSDHW